MPSRSPREKAHHVLVHVTPVVERFPDGGPRYKPALGAKVPFPGLYVIGVEKVCVLRARRFILIGFRQYEGLEEPARVSEVPLRRAHVGHRLYDEVFGFERGRQEEREIPYCLVAFRKVIPFRDACLVVSSFLFRIFCPRIFVFASMAVLPLVAARHEDGRRIQAKGIKVKSNEKRRSMEVIFNPGSGS